MKKIQNFGALFGESIEGVGQNKKLPGKQSLENSQSWDENSFTQDPEGISAWRLVPVYIVLAIFLILLFGRAFKLQVIDGETFLNKSQGNHVMIVANYAPRGVIYDRNGKVLARNKPGFRVSVRKIDLPEDWEKQVSQVAPLISAQSEELVSKIKKTETDSITLETNLTNEQIISLKTKAEEYPWLSIEIYPKREYPYGEALAPLLGYTSEAAESDLKQKDTVPYIVGDQVGKAGSEESFEKQLRGANGYQIIKVDSQGKKQGVLFDTKPISGNDITLSIDADLQKYIYDQVMQTIANKGGEGASVVAQDPKTGEILAMVSAPAYDNNLFSKPLTTAEYQSLINDPRSLLLNRPVESSFPPGSTFKLIVSAAGIETGGVTKDTKFLDTGFIQLGDVVFNNWLWLDHQKTEGEVNLVRAIARSNDTYFYRLGQILGEQEIYKAALQFGLGQKTGVELANEAVGLVPNAPWKEKKYGEVWYPGETLNMAIGQGYLLVSPVQLNAMTTAFASSGKLLKPTIIRGGGPNLVRENFLREETIKVVQEGMFNNTIGDGNVSYLFKDFKVQTAGKTGSAESGGENKSHSWYTAYGPYQDPKIAVTVMFERAGHGSEVSAPVVKSIFNYYLK